MIKNEYKVIGVMSGTSLDGIDLAHIHLKRSSSWHFEILEAQTVAYSEKWVRVLKTLVKQDKRELQKIDEAYTAHLAHVISAFIKEFQLTHIDAVCSHGHTALHDPDNGFTYQIGNLPQLAELISQTVVCDFRVQDVEFGGQGAPLVPIGDALLFKAYDYCLNLGGFANISSENRGQRIAYDICPVNIVLNYYVNQLGLPYDNKGQLASQGEVHVPLFKKLNQLEYYSKSFPKSLGLEWVQSHVFPLMDSFKLDVKTILCTFIEHIAFQISKTIQPNTKMLITGGGVFNTFLLDCLKKNCDAEIIVPGKKIIEFKEALIFAFLGVLKLRDDVNCLSSVTGAFQDHSSGIIYKI